MAVDYESLLEPLNAKQRLFVEAKLKGMSDATARRVAGVEAQYDSELAAPLVVDTIRKAQALSARDLGVTRETLHDMLMEAHRACADAKEIVLVARALADLYGLNAPKRLEVKNATTFVHKVEQLKSLTTAELEKLANSDTILDAEFTIPARIEHKNG